MATREEILGTIRQALQNGKTDIPRPQVPEVWATQHIPAEELRSTFAASLAAVAGETRFCANADDAAHQIADVLAAIGSELKVGIKPSFPLAQGVEKAFSGTLTFVCAPENPDADPQILKTLDASLVNADYLLADTGSAAIRSRSSFERLLCYLPPVCLIVAPQSALREHISAAWDTLSTSLKEDQDPKGEYLLMTGPSRTADIEKILILGVHGPKKVVVFVIENE